MKKRITTETARVGHGEGDSRRVGKAGMEPTQARHQHVARFGNRTFDLAKDVNRRFTDIIPGIRVKAEQMLWPSEDEPARTGRYCGNNLYRDLRGKSWQIAEASLQLEEELIAAADDLCRRRGGEAGEVQNLYARVKQAEAAWEQLDLGTIAAVHAISAAGGVPVSSCNGGNWGDFHGEPFPVVCFLWRPDRLPILRQCAKEAGVSMWLHWRGEVVIGADYIRRFLVFAQAILDRRQKIEARHAGAAL